MPLTLPNLDDRSYADLLEEARGLMVAYAPDFTNHNPSDPAVTLVELFAYVTDILLFRLNYVTDGNRIAFLRLLKGDPKWIPDPPESLEDEIRAAVLVLRRTDRAVTAADFESLAREPDPEGVARARCVPDRNLEFDDPALRSRERPGHVSVILVPSFKEEELGSVEYATRMTSLKSLVAVYLEPRRLLATRVHVVGPRYTSLRVRLTVTLLPDASEKEVSDLVAEALQNHFDPITGGDGTGWPFGRNVYVSDIYRLLDIIPGVDFVSRSLDTNMDPLDELVTDASQSNRLVRNAVGELIGFAVEPDELADLHVVAGDISVVSPLKPLDSV